MVEAMPLSELVRFLTLLKDILESVNRIWGETIGWFCIADNGGNVINSTLVSDLAKPKFITGPDGTTRPVGNIGGLLEMSRVYISHLVDGLPASHNLNSEGRGVIKVPGEDLTPHFFFSFCSNQRSCLDEAIILCLASLSSYMDVVIAREIALPEVRPHFEALLKDVRGIHNRQ